MAFLITSKIWPVYLLNVMFNMVNKGYEKFAFDGSVLFRDALYLVFKINYSI
jgi:hypothetical protein